MRLLKCCHSRSLTRNMFIAHIFWKRYHNVIFCMFLVVLCFSFRLYHQKTAYWHERDENELGNDDTRTTNPYRNESKLNESTDTSDDPEEVDMVYTWVNGSDPEFILTFEELMTKVMKDRPDVLALNRYKDWGTLRYSLRSVEKFAPWIRHVYLVTNGQVPYWLALNNSRITVVTHEEIFTNKSDLPAFTSPAIECHIHRIEGLSKRFIYMNDDLILTSRLEFSDFYTESEGLKLRFIQARLGYCNKLCLANNVNNGICEENCTTASCEFDGDDCKSYQKLPEYPGPNKDFMYDSWGGSLRHTHFLFNKAFGPQFRYVPEHAALMFDRYIFADLIARFPDEWERTSSTKVRHHLTVQPEFAYYNYLKVLENQRTKGVKTTTIWSTQNAEKIDFSLDDRGQVERYFQFKWCKREILLKRPKFLVFSDHFNSVKSETEMNEIQESITEFLQNMFPLPSEFEIT